MEQLLCRVQAALKLSVVPRDVPCRAAQEEQVLGRLLNRIRCSMSEMVYVSGQPGTGKTLTVHRVMETLMAMRDAHKLPCVAIARVRQIADRLREIRSSFEFVAINALNDLENPQSLFQHLWASLRAGERLSCDKAARELTAHYFSDARPSPIYLVLLVDELDSLLG